MVNSITNVKFQFSLIGLFLFMGSQALANSDLVALSLAQHKPLLCYELESDEETKSCMDKHYEALCELNRGECKRVIDKRRSNSEQIEWEQTYREMEEFMLANALFMERTARAFEIPTEALMGVFFTEHSINYSATEKTLDGKTQSSCAIGLPTTYLMTMGPGQIYMGRAREAQPYIEKYAGQPAMDLCDFHAYMMSVSGSITIAAGILRDAMDAYAENGVDLSDRPEILASLYNLDDLRDRARCYSKKGCPSTFGFSFGKTERKTHPRVNFFGFYLASHIEQIRGYLEQAKEIERQKDLEFGELKIIPREEWGAREPTDRISTYEEYGLEVPVYDRIVLHITDLSPGCGPEEVRKIERVNQGNTMDIIGYNYVIDACGNIYEGRDPKYVPAHAGQTNVANHLKNILWDPDYASLGIVFSAGRGSGINEKQVRAAKILIEWINQQDSNDIKSIVTHHEVKVQIEQQKPLRKLYSSFPELRRVPYKRLEFVGSHSKGACPGTRSTPQIVDIRHHFSPQIPFNSTFYRRVMHGKSTGGL